MVVSINEQSKSNSDDKDALDVLADKVKAAQDARAPKDDAERTGWAIGIRYASEFTAAVIVGGLLGYGIDHVFNTAPWFFLALLIFGFMAGTRNIVRLAKKMSGPIETGSGTDIGFDTEDEDEG